MADNNGGGGLGIIGALAGITSNVLANEWEKEATEEQFQNQLGLSAANANMAIRNWKATNFAEQRRQMERAGLSVGLMYKQGGSQGVSATPPGQIQKRNVIPMDVNSAMQMQFQAQQLRLQQQQTEANVKNTNADTNLKNVQAQNQAAGGIEYEGKAATIENLKQQTENAKLQNELGQFEKTIKEVSANIAQETERDIIYQIKAAGSKMMDEARSAYAQANVDQATQDERIKQIEQTTKEQAMRMIIMKLSGDKLVMETEETAQRISQITAEIEKTIKETENVDAKTANEKQKILLDKIASDFMYGDEAKAIRAFTAARQVMGMWGPKVEKFNPAKGGKR